MTVFARPRDDENKHQLLQLPFKNKHVIYIYIIYIYSPWRLFIFTKSTQIVREQVPHLRLCQGKCCTIPLGLALRCTQPIIFYSRIAFLIITSSIINLRFEFISRYQSLVQRPICAVGKASPFVWNHISHLHTFRDELRYHIYYYLNCICCIDYRYIAADVSRVWHVLFDLNMNQDKCWLQTLIWSDISFSRGIVLMWKSIFTLSIHFIT